MSMRTSDDVTKRRPTKLDGVLAVQNGVSKSDGSAQYISDYRANLSYIERWKNLVRALHKDLQNKEKFCMQYKHESLKHPEDKLNIDHFIETAMESPNIVQSPPPLTTTTIGDVYKFMIEQRKSRR